MTILLAGGSGFLGRKLAARLQTEGHKAITLSRRPSAAGNQIAWQPDGSAGALTRHLDGVDVDNPGTTLDRNGNPSPVPRIVAPVRRRGPILVRDTEFLRANTDHQIKVTIPGPFTMSMQAQDDHYCQKRDHAAAEVPGLRIPRPVQSLGD